MARQVTVDVNIILSFLQEEQQFKILYSKYLSMEAEIIKKKKSRNYLSLEMSPECKWAKELKTGSVCLQ